MPNRLYWSKTVLTGGSAAALDYIDGDDDGNTDHHALTDGDMAFVLVSGVLYVYRLDATSGATESVPSIIEPDTNAGTKRWILQRTFSNVAGLIDNVSFTATVSAKALTIALKGANGNDPSSGNSCLIGFRSATLTDSKPVVRSVSSPLSIVLSSGSTLGFTAALAGRLYLWAIDNAGTVELAVSRTADIFPEDNLVTTVAEGGAGGADSASTMYSTTQRTSVACRCLGYVEITTGATAGEWDNAPTKVQVMGPGVKRTGDLVQKVIEENSTEVDTALTIPFDNTTPQIGEGYQIFSKAFVATSAINKFEVDAFANVDAGQADFITIALFDGSADCLRSACAYLPAATTLHSTPFTYRGLTGSAASVTYSLRFGCNVAHAYLNRAYGGSRLNGTLVSTMEIREVFA